MWVSKLRVLNPNICIEGLKLKKKIKHATFGSLVVAETNRTKSCDLAKIVEDEEVGKLNKPERKPHDSMSPNLSINLILTQVRN